MAETKEGVRLWHSDCIAKLTSDPLVCLLDGPVAHVIINRPSQRNALTAQIWNEMPDVMLRLANDASVKLGSGPIKLLADQKHD